VEVDFASGVMLGQRCGGGFCVRTREGVVKIASELDGVGWVLRSYREEKGLVR
jgi:hypothetical protein